MAAAAVSVLKAIRHDFARFNPIPYECRAISIEMDTIPHEFNTKSRDIDTNLNYWLVNRVQQQEAPRNSVKSVRDRAFSFTNRTISWRNSPISGCYRAE